MSQFTMNPPFRNNLYAGAANSARLYVRPNVYLPNGEIDFQTGMLCEAQRRAGRTQALRCEVHQLDAEFAKLKLMLQARANEKGKCISMKTAIWLVASLVLLFSFVLLVQQGNIASRNHTVSLLNEKIKVTAAVVSDVQAQIDEASDPVKICYTAARDLDMVPGDSAQAIYLEALSTRPNTEPIAIRAGNN
jgi:hypothetical protein